MAARVLILDEDRLFTWSLQQYLAGQGCEVWCAENSRNAEELVASRGIGVVVSDILPARMGGVELLRKLKEKDRNLRIFIVSAFQREDIPVGLPLDGYFNKPIEFSELWRALAGERGKTPSTGCNAANHR